MVSKPDGSEFSTDEQQKLLDELNSLFPENIKFEHDGYFKCVVVLKAKNYVLWDGKKIKTKGSAFKSSTKEPALAELLNTVVNSLIHNGEDYTDIYERYVSEAMDINEISRWCVKKSITKKLLNGTRKNETKVLDALDIDDLQEGDKVYLYNAIDGEVQDSAKGELVFYKDGRPKMIPNKVLKLSEEFDGNYNYLHYVKRVYDTISILKSVIDMDKITKYHLSKFQPLLDKYKKSI
jgi:DNA polymerase elongation subunit (family B)